GPDIAKRFAADGVPVVGVSSLAYFRQQRTPAEIQKLIADAARRALAFGKADRLMMIGQSFGSDMMHVGLTGLPQDLRAKVKLVALVVPTD
ncbi:type IV secretion system protein VirJ, partial [Escherichia coli]|nr:type IV secretion system protein VirJ [Escherichia coli]